MLMAYSHHTSPTGLSDVLQKLATFATAQGWTVELQTNKDWTDTGGGVYGWTAGTHDFLELVSNGYGNQDLQFRFYREYIDASEDFLEYTAIDPGAGAYDTSSTLPQLQDYWNDTSPYQGSWRRMSCPNTTTPDVWFVGNDKFIAVHWKTAATHVQSFAFGTIELLPELQDRNDLQFFWCGQKWDTSSQANRLWSEADDPDNTLDWFNCFGYQLFVVTYSGIKWFHYKGVATAFNTTAKQNLRYHTAVYDDDPGDPVGAMVDFNIYKDCCVYNSFTQKRVLMKPTMFIKNPNNDGTFITMGHQPAYYLNVDGLVPGDILEMGNEEYICFPAFLTNNVYGVAYRVV